MTRTPKPENPPLAYEASAVPRVRRAEAESAHGTWLSIPSAPAKVPEAIRPRRFAVSRPARWFARASLLALIDGLAVVAAVLVGFLLWAKPVHGQALDLYERLWPLVGLFLLTYWRSGLYPGLGLGGVEIVRRLSLSTSFVFIILASFDFIFKLPAIYSRMTFLLAWGLALVAVPSGRFLLLALMRRFRWWGERCLVLGTGPVAERTVASLRGALTLGYRPTAVLARRPEEAMGDVAGVPVVGTAEMAGQFAAQGIRVAILVDRPGERWSAEDLAKLQVMFRQVLWIHRGSELPVEGIRLKNLGGVVGVEYANQLLLLRNRFLKRIIDLIFGSLLAILTAPLLLLCILAVRLSSRGSVFFSQEREGVHGRPIRVRKLRTMHANAESRLQAALAEDPRLRREWESRFKLEDDPRIVPVVGHFLRRFSLDELPQLWQVVAGTLSLVGPRPFPPYHLRHFSPAILDLRRQVRPGVTGLWQVKVRSTGDLDLQQSHDAYYIRNWSLWMDFYVLGRTAGAVLLGRGAV